MEEDKMSTFEDIRYTRQADFNISNKELIDFEFDMPKKVYITLPENQIELINKLFEKRETKLQVICPKRGEKANLVKMVENNIHINIEDKKNNVLDELLSLLEFECGIDSIECYDISNLRNEYIVGCMIRYENGKLNKSMYSKKSNARGRRTHKYIWNG